MRNQTSHEVIEPLSWASSSSCSSSSFVKLTKSPTNDPPMTHQRPTNDPPTTHQRPTNDPPMTLPNFTKDYDLERPPSKMPGAKELRRFRTGAGAKVNTLRRGTSGLFWVQQVLWIQGSFVLFWEILLEFENFSESLKFSCFVSYDLCLRYAGNQYSDIFGIVTSSHVRVVDAWKADALLLGEMRNGKPSNNGGKN